MASDYWPTWLNNLFAVTFLVILVMHLTHATSATGWGRWWHGTHVAMALGMIDMTWPGDHAPMSADTATSVFGICGVTAALVATLPTVRGRGDSRSWLLSAFDLGAMAYMFGMTSASPAAVTLVLAGGFLVESAAWASGLLAAPTHGGSARALLALMGLGMAYMLVAMQFGTPTEAPGPPGTGHHHHHAP